jgi:hypothetical protein
MLVIRFFGCRKKCLSLHCPVKFLIQLSDSKRMNAWLHILLRFKKSIKRIADGKSRLRFIQQVCFVHFLSWIEKLVFNL